MTIDELTHDDCLAHAALAAELGHGLHPWIALDDETQALAHQVLVLDPTADDGRQLLRQEPSLFAQWLARETAALQNAATIAGQFLPGTRSIGGEP